jgi:uncharacterized membrane-anchored protein
MQSKAAALAVLLCVCMGGPALADGGPQPSVKAAAIPATQSETYGKTGTVDLAGGKLRLAMPAGYYFLPAADAQNYLRRIGAAAPSGEVLGMVAPVGSRPIAPDFWGAVISYNPLGRIAEQRQDRLVDPFFVEEVRGARPPAPKLLAFSIPPAYAPATKTMTWAEKYETPMAASRAIRHEGRLFGRRGVAGATLDAKPEQFAGLEGPAGQILGMLSFNAGDRYRDAAATDPAPQFDLPGVLTLKPKCAAVAGPQPAPYNGGLSATAPEPTAIEPKKSGPNPMAKILDWLPWIGGGLVILGLIPLIGRFFRRRETVQADPHEGDGG